MSVKQADETMNFPWLNPKTQNQAYGPWVIVLLVCFEQSGQLTGLQLLEEQTLGHEKKSQKQLYLLVTAETTDSRSDPSHPELAPTGRGALGDSLQASQGLGLWCSLRGDKAIERFSHILSLCVATEIQLPPVTTPLHSFSSEAESPVLVKHFHHSVSKQGFH